MKNQNELSKFIKKKQLIQNPNPCLTAEPGSQEQVFCQVQKFPRIVVLPKAYGYLEVLELNPCVNVGKTNTSCGFNCCTQAPFSQSNNYILPNLKESNSNQYNPNPPFPPVPPAEQIRCYNIASRLNQCDVNKNNFFPNSGRPESQSSGTP